MRRVLEHVRQGDGREAGIDLHLTVGVGLDAQRVSLERVPDVRAGRIDDIGGRDPLLVHSDGGRVDARHVEDVLEQPREAVQFDAGRARLFPAFVGRQLAAEVFDRGLDRRQRRAQIVAQRGEQRRGEIGFLPYQLRRVALGQKLRALDRDRDDTGQGVERADVHGR